ncbi:hypothetical protein PROFUN_01431 [Planoprotostelium fungivorum]|uniref:Uncharacterized protein n=1 Tax=Planoprotostelium fungivorum TaxID=1890364 RepID=A0A2P6NT69_9EUKA|nr:hypothetical protein PROFUN_01431 [Planoprotostelium fungivorum]
MSTEGRHATPKEGGTVIHSAIGASNRRRLLNWGPPLSSANIDVESSPWLLGMDDHIPYPDIRKEETTQT